jgi:hypothetical protein
MRIHMTHGFLGFAGGLTMAMVGEEHVAQV